MLLPSNASCVLVQMEARTLVESPAYRRMSRHSFGDVAMSRIASVGQSVTALLDEIPAQAPESTQIQLVESGELILQQGAQQTKVRAGDMLVYDASRPFEFLYPGEFTTTIMQVSSRLLDVTGGDLQALASRPVASSSVAGGALAALLHAAVRNDAALSPHSREALSRAVADASRLLTQDHSTRRQARVASGSLARMSLEFVHDHLDDPGLSASRIAADFFVSVRTLHAAFEGERETLGQAIRRLRTARARRLLADNPTMEIRAVAESVGYLDVSNFIRTFKGAEGMTPAQWRRRQLGYETHGPARGGHA